MARNEERKNYFMMVGDELGNVYQCPTDAVRDPAQPRREELGLCNLEEHMEWPVSGR